MTRSILATALASVGAATLLAACSSGTSASSAAPSTGASALSTRTVSGVGTVVVDQSGKTVYTPDQEASGTIPCTAGCLAFWFPVTVASSARPATPSGLSGTLGTIHRPDNGETQLTYNGKPLYTFRLDQGPGQAQGNNFDDNFNGLAFTWRAVSTTAAQPGSSTAPATGGSSGSNY